MPRLSEYASAILDRMEPDVRYQPQDLRAFVPGGSIDHLREIMHELWVARQVERVGYSGWRRVRSAPSNARENVSSKAVKPEELFDHGTFADFFK